jgi:hypothetical protein
MSRHSLIYGLFCGIVILLSFFALRDGYSPFASGGARTPMMLGGYGPTHK